MKVTGTPATVDPAEFLTTADAVAEVPVAPAAAASISVVVVPGITSVSPVEVSVMVEGAFAVPYRTVTDFVADPPVIEMLSDVITDVVFASVNVNDAFQRASVSALLLTAVGLRPVTDADIA